MKKTDAIRLAVKEMGLRGNARETQERAIDLYVQYLELLYRKEAKRLGISEIKLAEIEYKYSDDPRTPHTHHHTLHKKISEAFLKGYISYIHVIHVRKKMQREAGVVYDCRTYEGQPGRAMKLSPRKRS